MGVTQLDDSHLTPGQYEINYDMAKKDLKFKFSLNSYSLKKKIKNLIVLWWSIVVVLIGCLNHKSVDWTLSKQYKPNFRLNCVLIKYL